MYVSSANEAYALDAGSGREIWRYQRPRTKGLIGNAAGGANRGVGIAGDRLFMVTDHAHVIALNRHTGALLWETEMADWRQNYNATGAPLPVGNLVVTGTSGGDEGVRGFVAAFDQATGKEVMALLDGARAWRARLGDVAGQRHRASRRRDVDDRCIRSAARHDLLARRQPRPRSHRRRPSRRQPLHRLDRGARREDRRAQVALPVHAARRVGLRRPGTDRARGHHLAGPAAKAAHPGESQRLLLRAGPDQRPVPVRDAVREDGDVGQGSRCVGTPDRGAGMEPTREGKVVCPSLDGAANWYSTSYNPGTGLYYVQTNDKCGLFTRTDMEWAAGKGFMGGSFAQAPDLPAQRVLRAIDIRTGKAVWELPQTGAVNSWGGTLSTAGGVVVFGEDSGALMAADAETGKPLWSFQTNQLWKASPMTYMFDNKQYVAVAAGPNIIAFGLPD